MHGFQIFCTKINLKKCVYLRGRERWRENSHLLVHSPDSQLGPGPADVRSWELCPGLPCGWQGPHHLSHDCCLLVCVGRSMGPGARGRISAHTLTWDMGILITRPNAYPCVSLLILFSTDVLKPPVQIPRSLSRVGRGRGRGLGGTRIVPEAPCPASCLFVGTGQVPPPVSSWSLHSASLSVFP